MNEMQLDKLFIVLDIERGIVNDIEAYGDLKAAFKRQEEWRKNIHILDSDVVVYETEVKRSSFKPS